jgi:hypothetical protein
LNGTSRISLAKVGLRQGRRRSTSAARRIQQFFETPNTILEISDTLRKADARRLCRRRLEDGSRDIRLPTRQMGPPRLLLTGLPFEMDSHGFVALRQISENFLDFRGVGEAVHAFGPGPDLT